jgi:hypothetical protein
MRDISGDEERSCRGKSCPPEGLHVFDALAGSKTRRNAAHGSSTPG